MGVGYGFTLWETTLGREVPAGSLSRVSSLDGSAPLAAGGLGLRDVRALERRPAAAST